jgi:hypothetical protein
MKTFYTYLWLREDGTPYYVGKGTGNRAYVQTFHITPVPSRDRILIQEFPSEGVALEAEKFLIAYYGRKDIGTGCLRNLTNGGEGISGYKYSEAHRESLRQRMLGNHHTLGMKLSEEFCRKQSDRLKGNKHSLGVHPSAESRKKMGDSHRGKPSGMRGKTQSEETRRKIAAALRGGTMPFKGKPWSEARRAAQIARQQPA